MQASNYNKSVVVGIYPIGNKNRSTSGFGFLAYIPSKQDKNLRFIYPSTFSPEVLRNLLPVLSARCRSKRK